MGAEIRFVDFSAIHLTKEERKLLHSVCGNTYRQMKDVDESAVERLEELGLLELFEPVDKNRAGVRRGFATAQGKAYLEYVNREKRKIRQGMFRWLIPMLLSVTAMALSVPAYTGNGNASTRSSFASTYVTQSVNQTDTNNVEAQTSSAEPGAAQQNGNTQRQNSGSGEAGASGEPSTG